jgi:hypothetical protein
MMHDLAPGTKHAIDIGSLSSAGVTGAVAAITLNQVAVMLTIISLLLNIAWMVFKFLYLRKHGPDAMWGAGND